MADAVVSMSSSRPLLVHGKPYPELPFATCGQLMDIQNKYQDIGGYTQGHHRCYRGLGRPGGAGDHQARVRVHCQGGLEQADIVIKDQVDGFQCHCDEVLQRMMVSNQLAQGCIPWLTTRDSAGPA